ncbi:MAG: phenylacetate--CoA ligase family protein [Acidimicrobiia bacterium]|nr:phenylacetate--CoA ligase family protein [Acidimicrobiia bacterium]
MAWERRKPSWIKNAQERALRSYLAQDVYPYSPYYQVKFDEAGVGQRSVKTRGDLDKLPLTTFDDVVNPASVVLRPDEQSIQQYARIGLVARVFWAKLWRREWVVNQRLIDPVYKPLHWHVDDGFPIGSSAEDVERLAELGRRWLELAGVARYDVLVSVLPPGPNLAYWQLVLGSRQAGVSALHMNPNTTAEQLAAARPNVIAGRPSELIRLLEAARPIDRNLDGLRTLLVAGARLDGATRRHLTALVDGQASVVAAWAPPGVRSLWVQCREGEGLHTAPDVELLEVVDPLTGTSVADGTEGEIVWTSLDWKGTVFLRLRTGVYGGVDDNPCPACGRTTPRLIPSGAAEPGFARVLDSHPKVQAWQAELRTVDGKEELIVYISLEPNGRPGRLLRELDRHLTVTQFVVLDRRRLDARLSSHGDTRVLDLRPAN